MCDGSLRLSHPPPTPVPRRCFRESVWCGGSIGRRWFRACCSNGVAFHTGVAATLDNVVEQFAPESEQPLDECFVEDPRANLRAIVVFTMRGVGLLLAYTRDPSWVRAMSVQDLEVLSFLCGDGGVLSHLPGADDAAKAAESTVASRRRRDPPDLAEVRAALQRSV